MRSVGVRCGPVRLIVRPRVEILGVRVGDLRSSDMRNDLGKARLLHFEWHKRTDGRTNKHVDHNTSCGGCNKRISNSKHYSCRYACCVCRLSMTATSLQSTSRGSDMESSTPPISPTQTQQCPSDADYGKC